MIPTQNLLGNGGNWDSKSAIYSEDIEWSSARLLKTFTNNFSKHKLFDTNHPLERHGSTPKRNVNTNRTV